MFRSTLIIFRELLNINTAYIRTLTLQTFTNSVKTFSIDRNMSALGQILNQIYNFDVIASVGFIV